MPDLDTLVAQARHTVAAVGDDPEARYALRVQFYTKYGFGGYGNSELAFMRWEIDRGVLDPPPGGSRWWRDVNASLLFDAELAALIYESQISLAAPTGSLRWLTYIRSPSETSWYVAHNGSIAGGYLAQVEAARAESAAEQQFMNIVLYRVLYAEALVSGKTFFGALGKLLGNPILPAVQLITDVPDFYPRDYPLTKGDLLAIEGDERGPLEDAVRLFDDDLIRPHATELYQHASVSLELPQLANLVRDGKPSYP